MTVQILLHSEDDIDDAAWNNWNFSTKASWSDPDSGFIYSNKTTILYQTVPFIIGKQRPHVNLKMTPERKVFKDKDVKLFAFFEKFVLVARDLVQERILFGKVHELNEDFQLEVSAITDGNSNTTINCNFDFTQRSFIYYNYGLLDFFKDFGAIKSTLFPIIGLLFPFMSVLFLSRLASIIQNIYDIECRDCIELFNEKALKLFRKMAKIVK